MIPRVASPNIAVIGEMGKLNYIEQDIADYWLAFKKIQRGTAAWLIVPAYRIKYFEDQESLETYVSDKAYLTDFEHQGICMGYDIDIKADNDIRMKFYFNDESYGAGPLAYGIPDQKHPSYVPFENAPQLPSYYKYARRGYQTLQNLAANMILQ